VGGTGDDRFSSPLQTKALRKAIQQEFKKFATMTEAECMFRFLETLAKIARFDIEIFRTALGVSRFFTSFFLSETRWPSIHNCWLPAHFPSSFPLRTS